MWRGYNREVLGLRGYAAESIGSYSGAQHRAQWNRSRRALYRRLRASGLTSYEALAKYNSIPIRRVRKYLATSHQNAKARGRPYDYGTPAWLERQVGLTAKKYQMI